MNPILQIKGLSVCDRKTGEKLVDSISLSIPRGGSLVLLGQSGSGKTMLCRCVMDLLNEEDLQTRGEIFFDGEPLLTMAPGRRRALYGRRIALIPQSPMTAFDPSQKMGRQLAETLCFHRKLSRSEAAGAVRDALLRSGLEEPDKVMSSYPFMLSGGMLQRCAIAVTVLLEPELVLADEPTTALDAEHRTAITGLLRTLRDKGTSVMLVTHDFVSASVFGGPAAVMKAGVLLEQGTVRQLLSDPQCDYTRRLLKAALI